MFDRKKKISYDINNILYNDFGIILRIIVYEITIQHLSKIYYFKAY